MTSTSLTITPPVWPYYTSEPCVYAEMLDRQGEPTGRPDKHIAIFPLYDSITYPESYIIIISLVQADDSVAISGTGTSINPQTLQYTSGAVSDRQELRGLSSRNGLVLQYPGYRGLIQIVANLPRTALYAVMRVAIPMPLPL